MTVPEAHLQEMEARLEEVERELVDPRLSARPERLRALGRQHAELKNVVDAWRAYRRAAEDLEEAKTLAAGARSEELAYLQEEIVTQERLLARLERKIAELLRPRDPNDERDVIVEIRAGTGGEEAGLFATDLFRMYSRYAENRSWGVEVLSSNESGLGGYRDVSFAVKGKGAYSRLKYEAGVHRVQRVPVTESSGRIHTSTAAVNVLPEAEEVDVKIDPNDLKVDVFRSSGPGGQSVNTTDSAVRVRHVPTGVAVECQEERSQIQNRARAMRILRARVLQLKQEEQQRAWEEERRAQVRTADRSERIRTYNFHENRVTDHRIGHTVHRLSEVLKGDLEELIDAVGAGLEENKREIAAS